jgi:hypothetical protein
MRAEIVIYDRSRIMCIAKQDSFLIGYLHVERNRETDLKIVLFSDKVCFHLTG